MKNPQVALVAFLCAFLFTTMASATQFKVGGSNGWSIPTNSLAYNQWAAKNRFRVGDSLLFTYPQGKDSVLVVDPVAYNNCNTTSYIQKFEDGNTVFTFDRSGLFFFISGVQSNCLNKESLIILVMGDRTRRQSFATPPALSPSLPPASQPPTSTGEAAPSPVPGETAPTTNPNPSSSPPSPSEGDNNPNPNSNPSPSPSSPSPTSSDEGNNPSPPPPNGASLKVVGLMGSIGPLVALAMFTL